LLRASAGVTRRSNSVTPLEPSTIDLAEKVDFIEAWFDERGLPAIVRSLPTDEPGLAGLLTERGYETDAGAHVMTRTAGEPSHGAGVTIDPLPSEGWLQALSRFGDDRGSPAAMRRLLEVLGPAAYATITESGASLAIGMGAVDGDTVAIYNMNVDPARRRRGLGGAILDALVAWGISQGAATAMLQVHPANEGGLAFYRQAGFQHRYTYWYRIRPQGASPNHSK
jgi:GNAT superfamily N-acetyltransferase